MGGGGGGSFFGRSASEVSKLIRSSVDQTADAEFNIKLAEQLAALLASFNGRDTQETAERLQRIKDMLGAALDGSVDTLFGGSVAKHTFVDGISDVDSLLILDQTRLANASPKDALGFISAELASKLGGAVEVKSGSIAVTITYPDGKELQLVPALRLEGILRVPAWENNTWSEINPQQFRDGLTKRNEECGGKVIPTIKLAKAICATLPLEVRPSGYHLESLAVAAFRGYEGEKNVVKMLPHLFERAKTLVMTPMQDRSGQSVHVDDSLGAVNSPQRHQLSLIMDRISRRMLMATASRSKDRWMELFGDT